MTVSRMLVQLKNNFNAVRHLMSKILYSFPCILAAFVLILQFFTISNGQDINATIRITVDKRVTAEIIGTFSPTLLRKNPRNFSILNDFAGSTDLARRFSNLKLSERSGDLLPHKAFSLSELVTERDIGKFSYTVDLTPLLRPSAAAHNSWANEEAGVLMLDDLLPQQSGSTALIKFQMPEGWSFSSSERRTGSQEFDVANIEKAVFYVGTGRREKFLAVGRSQIKLSISGEWFFSDEDAAQMVSSIFAEYSKIFGNSPTSDVNIAILKFPVTVNTGNWEADTRGRSVTIVSSDTPFKSQSKQRLHEQLRHEIFHLWMPNGVNLSGNFDWFYEGFALYQSLRTGVATNAIGFDNLLDTLSRAHAIDAGQAKRLSLIDASKNRFSGANTQVYARGMLVAFLCDLALLQNSKGKRSVENVLREIYQKHHNKELRVDGNEAVLAVFAQYPELRPITERYITGSEKIGWTEYLQMVGLETGAKNSASRLSVMKKLTSRQKDLLDKLGYNMWRKLSKD